jgi:hypothetical protein
MLHSGRGFHRGYWLLLLGTTFGSGCGRYAAPVPPERTSPQAIEFATITPAKNSISFSWLAPEKDARGDELVTLSGYRVYRRLVSSNQYDKYEMHSGENDDESRLPTPRTVVNTDQLEFSLITDIPDTSFNLLQKRREEAREKGTPVRKVSLSSQERTYTYKDTDVEVGREYLYKVVAYNTSSVEGPVLKLLRARASESIPLDFSFLDAASFEESSNEASLSSDEGIFGSDPTPLY